MDEPFAPRNLYPAVCVRCGKVPANHGSLRRDPNPSTRRWVVDCAPDEPTPMPTPTSTPGDPFDMRERSDALEVRAEKAEQAALGAIADRDAAIRGCNTAIADRDGAIAALADRDRAHATELAACKANVRTIVIVQRDTPDVRLDDPPQALEGLLFELSLGHQVMMVGPAGSGKTTLAKLAAEALSLPLYLVTCSPGMTEGALFGRCPTGERYLRSQFIAGYEDGGLICLDELDNCDPSTLAALNPALANGSCPIPRPEAPIAIRHPTSRIIGTANTFGLGPDALYVGRSQLDAATLDRFVTLFVDYDTQLEGRLARPEVCAWVAQIRTAINAHKLRRICSTRTLIRLEAYARAGKSPSFWSTRFFASWSASERALVESI